MNDDLVRAAKLYDDMLENYRNMMEDPDDTESADRFVDVVFALCELQIPNPFCNLDGYTFQQNAAIRPSEDNKLITGVFEQ